jgi:hypothetical protein
MAKKITLKHIENENKKYEKKKKVELPNGDYLYIYPNFSNEKIAELINEHVSDLISAKEEGIELNEKSMRDWGAFNIICKFSELEIPNDIKLKFQAFEQIIKYDYYTDIIAAFPEESFRKVEVAFNNFSENFKTLTQQEIERILEGEKNKQES